MGTGSMSMGPANARRVSSRGVFDHDSVELMLSEWLSRASGTEDVAAIPTSFTKKQVIMHMSSGLKTCQELARWRTGPTREAALRIRRAFVQRFRDDHTVVKRAAFSDAGCQQLLRRIVDKIACRSVFADLQEEVNMILMSMETCS